MNWLENWNNRLKQSLKAKFGSYATNHNGKRNNCGWRIVARDMKDILLDQRQKSGVPHWRATWVDNGRYTGEKCKELRKLRGVGRPI